MKVFSKQRINPSSQNAWIKKLFLWYFSNLTLVKSLPFAIFLRLQSSYTCATYPKSVTATCVHEFLKSNDSVMASEKASISQLLSLLVLMIKFSVFWLTSNCFLNYAMSGPWLFKELGRESPWKMLECDFGAALAPSENMVLQRWQYRPLW